MTTTYEKAVDALCQSFICRHYAALAGEPAPAWNRTVQFVLAQQRRMPDYLRFPLQIATLVFNGVAWLALRSDALFTR